MKNPLIEELENAIATEKPKGVIVRDDLYQALKDANVLVKNSDLFDLPFEKLGNVYIWLGYNLTDKFILPNKK